MTKTRVVLAMAVAVLLTACGQGGAVPSATPTITHGPTATPTIVPTQTPAPRATPTERKPSATPTPPLPSGLQADYDFLQCYGLQALPVGQEVTSGMGTFSSNLDAGNWGAACLVIPAWVDSVAEARIALEACPQPGDPFLVNFGAYYSRALDNYATGGDFLLDACASSALADRLQYQQQALLHMNTANELLQLGATALADYAPAP